MKNFLTKRYLGISLWWYLIPLGIGLLGLILGSFLDWQIDSAIASGDSIFGQFGESYLLVFPFLIAGLACAALAIGLFGFKKKVTLVLGIAVALSGAIAFGILCGKFMFEPFGLTPNLPKAVAYILGILLVAGSEVGGYFLFRKADMKTLLFVGASVLLILALSYGTNELVKNMCLRPRFRYLTDPNTPVGEEYYRAWYEDWQFFSTSKYKALDPELVRDYVKSFPSGHTSMASIFLSFAFLACPLSLDGKSRKVAVPCLYAFGVAFVLITMIARMRAGAHFLSDVSFAVIETSVYSIVVFLVGDKIYKKVRIGEEKPE